MNIIEIDKNELQWIRSLWEELNALHGSRSTHSKDHFANFTFERRIEMLMDREHLVVFAVQSAIELVGYCIATANGGSGELDSLYVRKAYRGAGLGARLSNRALEWLNMMGCTEIRVAVAEGNEEAIPFYQRLGFQERFRVLQLKKP